MSEDIRGVVVPEPEVAADLGFADVHEFRRWQTDMGHKVADLEWQLQAAKRERDRFRATGLRMMKVLGSIADAIDAGESFTDRNRLAIISDDLRLAIGVVMGKQTDWGGEIEKWLNGE